MSSADSIPRAISKIARGTCPEATGIDTDRIPSFFFSTTVKARKPSLCEKTFANSVCLWYLSSCSTITRLGAKSSRHTRTRSVPFTIK